MAVDDTEMIESIRFVPADVAILARPALASDTIRVSEDLLARYGVVVMERLRLVEASSASEIANVTIADIIDIVEQLYLARNAVLTDTVGIVQGQLIQRLAQVFEGLGLSETPQGSGVYHLTITQGLRLVSSLGRFLGVDIADDLGLTEVTLARVLAFAHVDETLDIGSSLVPRLLLRVSLDDAVGIEPAQALRMLFQPTVAEGIEFEAGYLAPDGSFTTWVMNTRSGAVTEYDNYVFNSFAQMGNSYVAASDSGLYELLGDDDDGEDIIARIRGGFLQFGGTHLSRLKEAYVATTGDGHFVLKIRTKDGLEYNYGVDARGGRSTKFHMGKGQKSRYFGYELISAGQDFDLDTLEFVPLVVSRRV